MSKPRTYQEQAEAADDSYAAANAAAEAAVTALRRQAVQYREAARAADDVANAIEKAFA